jgi:S-adenosylmethionine synthetase
LLSENIVLRIPVLYGPVEYLGESAVTTLLQILTNDKKEASVSDYEIRRPAHVGDMAKIASQLVAKKKEVRAHLHNFISAVILTFTLR